MSWIESTQPKLKSKSVENRIVGSINKNNKDKGLLFFQNI